MPTYGELFAGIGGMSLGLERAGWTPRWFAENDAYCSRVLAKHWPDVPNLGDVTVIDWDEVERVELVCGGFPCQPFSSAGLQRGAADARYLWPEVVRALRVLRPRCVLLENVAGLVAAPEFGTVLGDLSELGFDAEWDCLPAAAFGAPHLRYRVFVVAHSTRECRSDGAGFVGGSALVGAVVGADGRSEHGDLASRGAALRSPVPSGETYVADADASGREGWAGIFGPAGRGQLADSGWWAVEPDVDRMVDGSTRIVDRGRRVQALGNAVVPQVAEWIGARLLAVLPAYAENEMKK